MPVENLDNFSATIAKNKETGRKRIHIKLSCNQRRKSVYGFTHINRINGYIDRRIDRRNHNSLTMRSISERLFRSKFRAMVMLALLPSRISIPELAPARDFFPSLQKEKVKLPDQEIVLFYRF